MATISPSRRLTPLRLIVTRGLRALAFIGLAVACSDATGPPTCPGSVTVTVGPGTTPTVRWTPVCALSDVFIQSAAPGSGPTWRVTMLDASNRILPPITYGDTLPGALNTYSGVPLTAGAVYTAVVGRTDSLGHIVQAGAANFSP